MHPPLAYEANDPVLVGLGPVWRTLGADVLHRSTVAEFFSSAVHPAETQQLIKDLFSSQVLIGYRCPVCDEPNALFSIVVLIQPVAEFGR